MSETQFSKLKGEERQWRIEEAASTLKRYVVIKKDQQLMKAAREELKRQVAEDQETIKEVNRK